MSIVDLAKPAAHSVVGIDASTHSLAFAVIEDHQLTKFGEITLSGSNFYDRLIDCRKKSDLVLGALDADYIGIEKAIMARSTDTALKLGMIVGVVISALASNSTSVEEVAPISWQSYIGNPILSGKKKQEVIDKFPGKTGSWINNHIREMRKQRTIEWAEKRYNKKINSDNVADAIGIATFVAEQRIS